MPVDDASHKYIQNGLVACGDMCRIGGALEIAVRARAAMPVETTTMDPIAYTVPEVLQLIGIGRTKLYEAITSGDLTARKVGNRTIILREDLLAWLSSLPLVKPGASSSSGR